MTKSKITKLINNLIEKYGDMEVGHVYDYYKSKLIGDDWFYWEHHCRPYLRPMESMTEEELQEYGRMWELQAEYCTDADIHYKIELFDWLNKKMFDYRGLIPMGLALEAPEGMYETK